MKTLTDSIYDELIEGAKDPAGLPAVLKEHSNSKGPLYIALAKATNSLSEKLNSVSTQYQNAKQEYDQRQQAIKAVEQTLVDLGISSKNKAKELADLNEKVKKTGEIVNQGKELAGLGFGMEELKKLWALLIDIKASEGETGDEAIKLFFKKINTYQKFVSLESQHKANQIAIQKAQAEVEKWKAEAKAAEAKTKARQISINIIEKWLTSGVKEKDLPHWEHILSKSGITPEQLAGALDEYSTIEKLCHNREESAKKFETQTGNLAAQVKALKEERQQTSAAISDVREKALAEIEGMARQTLENVVQENQNLNQVWADIHQKTILEIDASSKTVLGNLQALAEKTREYVALESQAAKLAEELKLARAFSSQDIKDWRQVSREGIRKLLQGIIAWTRADTNHNTRLTAPTNELSYKLCYYSITPASLEEVLGWALSGTYSEQERNLLGGYR
jgi:hypothetical protein